MGKRKERRLAAQSATGRRVKLDLFAEPCGNSCGPSAKDEVGVDNSDSKTGAKLPSSPASTGKKLQNPLLLLGQYSDDELDGSLSELHNECGEERSTAVDDEAKIVGTKTTEDTEADDVIEPCVQTGMEHLEMVNNDSASQDPSFKSGKEEITPIGEAICAAPSDEQVVGDVNLGWKMVLHEESNQYYYWNIKTGETSWEVPLVLTQEAVENCIEKPAGDGNLKAVDADQGTEADKFDEKCRDDSLDNEIGNTYTYQNQETSLLNGEALVVNGAQANDSTDREENRTGADLSLLLVKNCESLLERLNSVKSLNQQWQDFKLKSTLEVETRLADIKALASHGSSLLPFWLHSEAQLNCLEAVIDNVIQTYDSASTSEHESTLPAGESRAHDSVALKSKIEDYGDDGGKIESNGVEMRTELVSTKFVGDDVDMDVDMEVEDMSNTNKSVNGEDASGAQYHHVHSEQLDPPIDMWVPPLPPENEPFPPPPPPPENEPSPPPPPPDELADTSYPPTASLQSYPYPEQYILQYPGSSLGYYGQTNAEVTGSALYTHPVSDIPHYYDAVSNVYAVEPSAYYGLQNGTLNPVPLVNGATVESLGIQSVIDSAKLQSVSNLLPNTNVNVAKEPEVSDAQATVEPQPTSDATTSYASKVQSKVTRTKKRPATAAPTLRSNKKVSSLVEKWKAAKEELQEDEEPDSAYEALEKKKQREIEEWRAQQIASGEAKDNANFQPLGGDWRERVKRKRAQKLKESEKSNASKTTEGGGEPPDLIESSRGLPSGWQAYWDESSKQVYYGNVATSETSWIRPKSLGDLKKKSTLQDQVSTTTSYINRQKLS